MNTIAQDAEALARFADRAEHVEAKGVRSRIKHLLLGAVGLTALVGVGIYGERWWTTGRFVESTDDAYTASDAVAVAPRVAGMVAGVDVTDNQRVRAGQALARLDDRDYRAALDQARANVASAQAQIGNIDAQIQLQQSLIDQAQADIGASEAALQFSRADWQRYANLARNGIAPVRTAQQAASDFQQRQAAVTHSRKALTAARQQVEVLRAQRREADAALARAQANVRQAELNLSYTTIASPIDGAVGDRSLRLGQYVQPGTRVLDVVPTGREIYVVANFKETQLAHMTRGEAVNVSVDMLGGKALRGYVDSLAPGSGAQFALLPPENATGNFTKIVQRVPVKIRLEGNLDALARLRPGLSVVADVDTRTAPPGPARTLVDDDSADHPIQAASR